MQMVVSTSYKSFKRSRPTCTIAEVGQGTPHRGARVGMTHSEDFLAMCP